MIPADVVSRLRLVNDLSTQPTSPVSKLTDALSDFVPGQRVMAEIQALLPNGTYRAMIAQREITLALPFAAKSGDSLELEVVDTDGKLALAVIAQAKGEDGADKTSASTNLTQTGRLIGDLLAGLDREGGKRPQPAPLNNAQPLVEHFPDDPADLAPILKNALTQSGMFYESHQARWVEGSLPKEALLQEPQGKLSVLTKGAEQAAAADGKAGAQAPATNTPAQAAPQNPPGSDIHARAALAQVMAPDLAPLVQQQLEALATQTYVWQGQVWPGQQMHWEIIEEESRQGRQQDDTPAAWTTHLRLHLPNLGGVEATLRLAGGQDVEISIRTDSESARQRLNIGSRPLQEQFETAGLTLKSLAIARQHVETEN